MGVVLLDGKEDHVAPYKPIVPCEEFMCRLMGAEDEFDGKSIIDEFIKKYPKKDYRKIYQDYHVQLESYFKNKKPKSGNYLVVGDSHGKNNPSIKYIKDNMAIWKANKQLICLEGFKDDYHVTVKKLGKVAGIWSLQKIIDEYIAGDDEMEKYVRLMFRYDNTDEHFSLIKEAKKYKVPVVCGESVGSFEVTANNNHMTEDRVKLMNLFTAKRIEEEVEKRGCKGAVALCGAMHAYDGNNIESLTNLIGGKAISLVRKGEKHIVNLMMAYGGHPHNNTLYEEGDPKIPVPKVQNEINYYIKEANQQRLSPSSKNFDKYARKTKPSLNLETHIDKIKNVFWESASEVFTKINKELLKNIVLFAIENGGLGNVIKDNPEKWKDFCTENKAMIVKSAFTEISEFSKKAGDFGRVFQEKSKEAGVDTGREGSEVGLRLKRLKKKEVEYIFDVDKKQNWVIKMADKSKNSRIL